MAEILLNLFANNDTVLGARRTRPASGGKEQVERDGTGAKGRNPGVQVGRHSTTRSDKVGSGGKSMEKVFLTAPASEKLYL